MKEFDILYQRTSNYYFTLNVFCTIDKQLFEYWVECKWDDVTYKPIFAYKK